MPILKTEAEKLIAKHNASVMAVLRGHFDLLNGIYQESDWAFVIKAHALLEACVTQVLLDIVGDERIKKVIERLPLSDEEIGKIAIGKELGVLSKEQRRFIREMSSLRNSLAHKIENVDMTLRGYVDAMDKNKRNAFIESVLWSEHQSDSKKDSAAFALKSPKLAIKMFLFTLIAEITLSGMKQKTEREIDAKCLEYAEQLYREIKTK